MKIKEYALCECGAVTIFTDDGKNFSCRRENLARFFPQLDLAAVSQLPTTFSCNHCINHYGLDLCACGSGEPYETCDGGDDCCGIPMQSLEKGYTCVRADDALGDISPNDVKESDLVTNQNLAISVQQAIDSFRQAQVLTEKLRDDIVATIQQTSFEGVTEISSSPKCFILSLSTVMKQPGVILTAEYYSPACQADLVHKALTASTGNIFSLMKKVSDMVEKRCVVISKFSYRLNDITLGILQSMLQEAGWSEQNNLE